MKLLEARARALRVEMEKGSGGGPTYPFPVCLEPEFAPFDHAALAKKARPAHSLGPQRSPPFAVSVAEIRASQEDDFKGPLAEQVLPALNPRQPLAFEVVGCFKEVKLQLAGTDEDVQAAIRQISAHYPSTEAFLSLDKVQGIRSLIKCARSYRLKESYPFPIRTGHAIDPYAALLGDLDGLEQGECVVFQVLSVPVRHDWSSNILRLSRDPWDPSRSAFIDLPQLPKIAEGKVATPLFAVAVRLAASSVRLLDRLEGSFLALFNGEQNGFMPREEACPVESVVARVSHHHGMILNARELAGLAHIPDPDSMPESLEVAEPGAPAPPLATRDILVPLGVNRHRGVETPVGIPAEWLPRHVFICGLPGAGKSNLLTWFLKVVDAGYGLAFIDPAGDTAEWFLKLIPEHRVKDTIYVNPADREFPPSLNVLEASSQREREKLAGEFMVTLERLAPGLKDAPRGGRICFQGARTLAMSCIQRAIYDLPRLLSDAAYRASVLETVDDPELLDFWKREFPRYPANATDPVLYRLGRLLDDPLVRNVLSQRESKVHIQEAMAQGKVLIFNLSKGILGNLLATLLGGFFLSKLQLVAQGRAAVPEGERRLYPIIIDEAQNWAGAGLDTSSIRTFLTESRKYGTPLVMATQYLSQLDREVVACIFGTVSTFICLRSSVVDAQILQKELGEFSYEDLLNLSTGEALCRMGRERDTFNVTIPRRVSPDRDFRQEIIALSRKLYARPRAEVENLLRGQPEAASRQQPPKQQGVKARERTDAPAAPELTPDQWRMLEYLADHPDETVTVVYKALGFSAGRGSKVRQELKDKGLAAQLETRLGQGNRPALFLVPTIAGLRAVNKPLRSGRGSGLHRYIQDVVARRAHALGFQPTIEFHLEEGGSVDVHLSRGEEQIAVEIAIQSRPQRECQNIRKCLRAAGYHRVIALFLDPGLLQEAQALFTRDASPEERLKVVFLELGRLEEGLR